MPAELASDGPRSEKLGGRGAAVRSIVIIIIIIIVIIIIIIIIVIIAYIIIIIIVFVAPRFCCCYGSRLSSVSGWRQPRRLMRYWVILR